MSTKAGPSRAGRKNARRAIPYKLHSTGTFPARTFDRHVRLASFRLEMPSDLEISKTDKRGYPLVLLDLKDDSQLESFKIMKTSSHRNILEVYLVDKAEGEQYRVYVEPFVGVLSKLFRNIEYVISKDTRVVPSVEFQDIVRDIIAGLNYLRENGQYHGNFAWETTLYDRDHDKVTAKLANFEKKRSTKAKQGQVADCVSLGNALAQISQRVQQIRDVSTCCLIDDLADILISVTSETLDAVMSEIKNDIFFWDKRKRKTFAAVDLPEAWDHPSFITSFTNSLSVPHMPWTNEAYGGCLAEMELYRKENGIVVYDDHDWTDFLRCISGMYTHEKEFNKTNVAVSVDSAVHQAHLRLFRDLKVAVDEMKLCGRKELTSMSHA